MLYFLQMPNFNSVSTRPKRLNGTRSDIELTKHRLRLKEIVRHLHDPLIYLRARIRQHIRQILQHQTARRQIRHAREDPLKVMPVAAPNVDEQLVGLGPVEAVEEPGGVVHLGPVEPVLHLALHVPAKVAPELWVVREQLPAVVALGAGDVHEVALLGVQRVLVVCAGEELGEVAT